MPGSPAMGVETIARKTFTVDAQHILALAGERLAVGFVLGLPINMRPVGIGDGFVEAQVVIIGRTPAVHTPGISKS